MAVLYLSSNNRINVSSSMLWGQHLPLLIPHSHIIHIRWKYNFFQPSNFHNMAQRKTFCAEPYYENLMAEKNVCHICAVIAYANMAGIWWPEMNLTLNVRGRSYIGLTMSISWLLMLWLLSSPGHQQPWYWQCRIGRSLSYLRKDSKYICHINVEEWHKIQIYVFVPSEKFST